MESQGLADPMLPRPHIQALLDYGSVRGMVLGLQEGGMLSPLSSANTGGFTNG